MVEALTKRRRIVAIDINPIATFLTRTIVTPINLYLLIKEFEKIKESVSEKILRMYETKCPKCGNKAFLSSAIWTISNGKARIAEIRIHSDSRYRCQSCGFNDFHKLSDSENKSQQSKQNIEIPYWYPKSKIKTKLRKPPVNYFYELFTKRNLFCLSLLFNEISKISDKKIKDAFFYLFTDMLYACSKMQMYSTKTPKSTRGWTAPRFYIPAKNQERNVWIVFENKFNRFYKAKKILNKDIYSVTIAENYEDFLTNKSDVLIMNDNALSFKILLQLKFNYAYLDPPFQKDIEYLAFSEFWGCWLKQKFDYEHEILPYQQTYFNKIEKILHRVSKNIIENGKITIAFETKKNAEENLLFSIFKKLNLEIQSIEPIIYPNPQIRHSKEKRGGKIKNNYITLRIRSIAKDKKNKYLYTRDKGIDKEIDQLKVTEYTLARYHLWWSSSNKNNQTSTDYIKSKVREIIPKELMQAFTRTSISHLKDELKNENKKARRFYYTLCYHLLNEIMDKNDWELLVSKSNDFTKNAFEINSEIPTLTRFKCDKKKWIEKNIDITAINKKKNQRIYFIFKDRKDNKKLQNISETIFEMDKKTSKNESPYSKFKDICVLILGGDTEEKDSELKRFRSIEKAKVWKRGFFTTFFELWEVAYEKNKKNISSLINEPPSSLLRSHKNKTKVKTYNAEVIDNIPVKIYKNQNGTAHYKMRLKIKDLPRILPGQFLLVDCMTKKDMKKYFRYNIKVKDINSILNQIGNRQKRIKVPLLKRPFGIHRTYYPNFDRDYLKRMDLPKHLSWALHTTFPNIFEIFYGVKEEGIGTKLMAKLSQDKKNQEKINVVGTLGRPVYIDDLLRDYSDFVLIGGGTGMAPLVFFAQALKYYNASVKTFIGIDSFDNLKHKDPHARSFTVPRSSVYLYIDDLKEIGVIRENIYVSIEEGNEHDISRISKIPVKNIYKGFVSEQFEKYVNKIIDDEHRKKICIVTCGPIEMMGAIYNITKQKGLHLKVYLEQRMACGVGVCLSCVQKTKDNYGNKVYKRVCIDGPIFDADEIIWGNK